MSRIFAKFKLIIRGAIYIVKLYLAYIIFKVIFQGKTITDSFVLGSSNGKYCDENVISFFEYLVKKGANVQYVIDRGSVDRAKVENIGDVLTRFSFKANLKVFRSEFIIYDTSFIDLIRCNRKWLGDSTTINVFHGIHGFKKISDENANSRLANDDFIIASSDFEKQIKLGWGFSEDRILLTGLPRYDTLFDASKLQSEDKIFFMPTWRPWFKKGFLEPTKDDVEEFKQSFYYRSIVELISSEQLNDVLKNSGTVLEVYIHKLMHRYIKNINITSNLSNIKILGVDTNVQERIIESKYLITDYSSVALDFLFLDKNVFLYQFDKDEFYSKTFGSYIKDSEISLLVAENLKNLIDKIEGTLSAKGAIKGIVSRNSLNQQEQLLKNKFIKFVDNKNCERLYNSIIEIEKEINK